MDYKKAGVDIEAGNEFVRRIRPLVRSTFRPEVLTDIGGFGGLFRFDPKKYRDPVLVSGTDGVGTKLRIAFLTGRHDTVGIDLVAMCVNDVAVCGAEPLFFLDYLAVGKLAVGKAETIVAGIAEGCRQAGCALIGGETAEMPGFYADEEYDLAGFAVGVVERDRLIDGTRVRPGDALIGLASTGLHSNGYSLARRVLLDEAKMSLDKQVPELDGTLGEALLRPTRIYVNTVRALVASGDVRAIAHITGGGLTENIPRVLPEGCRAVITRGAWKPPALFGLIQSRGRVEDAEMARVFNLGIGLVLVVPADQAEQVIRSAQDQGDRAFRIGAVEKGGPGVSYA
ncbi:MAG: phosphoribosylformylglycinamidine cyclo-ligase [Nitrospirae bacterium]|nr:MAG: phosphoribosylformylglycinamidine cyclo-ligase [Nitrospirota bacterium]